MATEIPDVVVQRLPYYVRALRILRDEGIEVVSSHDLGRRLQVTPAQIRKDLSYFGRFGKQGRGYDVRFLLEDLSQILGLDREWPAILVGMGRLGRAIASYPGFTPEGFHIVAAFDSDESIVGRRIGHIAVKSLAEMRSCIEEEKVEIAIVAVPAEHAQGVIDQLVVYGIKAILNYAPISPRAPGGVYVRTIDPVQALQTMTFHVRKGNSAQLPVNSRRIR